ncbi:NAD-dependent protein deacylase [Thalassocella blandensis]|nr:NAD-dependent protein deacylase [Thalassocella blandensis]
MLNPYDFNSVVVLTGAGISAESGLKTFRDSGGLWEGHSIEEVATPNAFNRNPDLVHTFYNLRRKQLLDEAAPNTAHMALADFEKNFEGNFTLITQNVDNLHEQAGSQNIFHMHGELLKARCLECRQSIDWDQKLETSTVSPCCNIKGSLRPDIVWFGEIPMHMKQIEQILEQCDLFVSIGTSGQVYPAAGFMQMASFAGAKTVELNLEACGRYSRFDHAIYGPATKIVRQFFDPASEEKVNQQ